MFGFLKNILRKPAEAADERQRASAPEAAPAGATLLSTNAGPLRKNGGHANGGHQNGKYVELPLQAILHGLPLELQPKVKFTNVGDLTISIPLEKVLSQLSRGTVKITFGELRQAAPQVFSMEEDRDRVLVPLPLGEILSRLSPAFITRRRVQKQLELPEEINGPFDPRSQGLIFSVGPGKVEPETTPVPPATPALPRHASPPSPVPAAPGRSSLTFASTPPPPAATPPRTPAMISATRALREMSTPAPAVPAPAIPAPAVPAPAAPQPARTVSEAELLVVGLTLLAESWPEAVRKEIVALNLVEGKVALPLELVGQSLRQGRIAFSWKTLRSWVRPAALLESSANDGTMLELPLKVVAPLYLARQKEANNNKQKVAVGADIPNLFFGFPQPAQSTAPAAPASNPAIAKPVDTNYYVWDDAADTVKVDESELKRPPTPGTKFVAKYATPNEVVSRASALDGVAGALIALPDGLMVASRLSADLNADTLAAFLPHIFGKVSQCTKELRMGELNNLNFTVGNVPWKIFRVNAIFFAAFGRAGEGLPTGQLAALATELDHKPK